MMLMTQSAVRALLNAELEEPSRFMDVVNQTIYGNAKRMQTGRTLTLSLLDYSPSKNSDGGGQLTVSGYHEEVIIVRQNGQVERLDTAELGVPVGLVDEMVDLVQRAEIKLDPGDGIALYTDGITEAENVNGEQYGLDRLCRVLSDHWTERAAVIIEVAVGDVRDFMGERPQFDDLTLVVLKQE
jgi:sigma-B regulation protein RsbU (phosphoserine phosphatase)